MASKNLVTKRNGTETPKVPKVKAAKGGVAAAVPVSPTINVFSGPSTQSPVPNVMPVLPPPPAIEFTTPKPTDGISPSGGADFFGLTMAAPSPTQTKPAKTNWLLGAAIGAAVLMIVIVIVIVMRR